MSVDLAEARFLYGSEHEMAVRARFPGEPHFHAPGDRRITAILGCTLPDGLQSVDLFGRRWLSNGGMWYIDHEHLEATTPEVTTTRELMLYELSNEQIALHLLEEASRTRSGGGKLVEESTLDASVVDRQGNSWGYHINLLLERKYLDLAKPREEIEANPIMQQFALFLATWGIIVGNGGIVRDRGDGQLKFFINTKSSTLRNTFHRYTIDPFKPLVNLRDEAHAGPNPEFIRMHVVSTDYNTAPWSKRMAAGMSALTLKALGMGLRLEPEFPIQPDTLHRIAKKVSLDPECKDALNLDDGRTVTVIDIQYAFLNMVKKLTEHCDLDEDMQWVLHEWEHALDCLKDDPQRLEGSASWPLKYRRLGELVIEQGLGWGDERVQRREFGYNHITNNPSVTLTKLRTHSKIWGREMPSGQEIQQAMRTPPETRARLRGAFVAAHAGLDDREVSVMWDKVTVRGRRGEIKYPLDNPFIATYPELELYLADRR